MVFAMLANSIGPQGNLPCRFCWYGGTQDWKKSLDGLKAVIEASLLTATLLLLLNVLATDSLVHHAHPLL
jgi:hypothetical protein